MQRMRGSLRLTSVLEHYSATATGCLQTEMAACAGLPPSAIQRKLYAFNEASSGRGSAWLERLVRDQEAGGSNPLAPTILFTRLFSTPRFSSTPKSPQAVIQKGRMLYDTLRPYLVLGHSPPAPAAYT